MFFGAGCGFKGENVMGKSVWVFVGLGSLLWILLGWAVWRGLA